MESIEKQSRHYQKVVRDPNLSLRNHNWLNVVKMLSKFGYAVT